MRNPEKPDRMGEFRAACEGLAKAGSEFGIPYVSGNVSFYNETAEYAVPPTHETTIMLRKKVEEAKCVVISTPVYNFNVSSTAKNFVELTGRMWEGKIAGFMSAAGGRSGYMSVMSLANSLMLDFRVVIIPKHVHAERSSFKDEKIEKEIEERIEDLAKDVIKFSNAL